MRERLALVVGVVIVLLLLFGRAALPGYMPADMTVMRDTYHLSVICASFGERVFAGASPLWLDDIGAGFPLHALWMYGCFSPTTLFWALLPLESAYTWSVIAHLALGAAGVHALLCAQGAERAGALTGAVVFAICEYTVSRAVSGHANQLWALGWAPWVLWAAHGAVHGRRHSVPVLAVVGALALLAGHVQLWFFLAPFAVVFALVETSAVADRKGALQRLTLAALLVILLTAVQWLPAAELAMIAGRPESNADLLVQWSAPVYALAAKVAPGMLGFRPDTYFGDQGFEHEHAGLGGAAVLLLVLLGLRRERRRVFLALAAVLGLVLALGHHFAATAALHELPLIGWGRVAARTQVLTVLAGAVLAGHGVSDLLRAERGAVRRLLVAAGATLAVTVAGAAVVWSATGDLVWPRPVAGESLEHGAAFVRVAVPALLASLLGAALVAGALLAARKRAALGPLVAVAALVGVWLAGLPPLAAVESGFLHIDWKARLPDDAAEHRVFLLSTDFREPYVERAGLRSFRRAAHVDTRHMDLLKVKGGPSAARWLDVGSAIRQPGRGRGPPVDLSETAQPFPTDAPAIGRARFFPSAAAGGSDDDAVRRLGEATDALLIAGDAVNGRPMPPDDTPVEVTGGGSELICEFEAPSEGWLFLSEKWYPGWTCEVNGVATTIERANVALRAVPVKAGPVRAVFRYEPAPLRLGAIASLLGVLLVLVMGLLGRRAVAPEAE